MRFPAVLLIALVTASCFVVTIDGQELDATVSVNMDLLQLDQRVEVQAMANDVRNYLNNQRFTNADWDGPRIPITVTIYLNSRNGDLYSGKLAIVSKRLVNNDSTTGSGLLRVFDQDWQFRYSFSQALTFQLNRYDPFSSLIDFYVLIAIGMDMDTYDDLGGSRMYDLAKQIASLGNSAGISQFSSNFQPGEYTRMALVSELTDLRYVGLRRLIYDYHVAIDEYAVDKVKGREGLVATISGIAEYKRTSIANRSILLQAFFDAKSQEIADIFKGQTNSKVWDDLRFLDPGNTQLYETARGG